jgi:hypothetical protein
MRSLKFKNGRSTVDLTRGVFADTGAEVPVVGVDGEVALKRAWRGISERDGKLVETHDHYVEDPSSPEIWDAFDKIRFDERDGKFHQVPSWDPR